MQEVKVWDEPIKAHSMELYKTEVKIVSYNYKHFGWNVRCYKDDIGLWNVEIFDEDSKLVTEYCGFTRVEDASRKASKYIDVEVSTTSNAEGDERVTLIKGMVEVYDNLGSGPPVRFEQFAEPADLAIPMDLIYSDDSPLRGYNPAVIDDGPAYEPPGDFSSQHGEDT